MVLIYCMRCRKKTDSDDLVVSPMKNKDGSIRKGMMIYKGKCDTCRTNKSQFGKISESQKDAVEATEEESDHYLGD
jgi:hypothetical protein